MGDDDEAKAALLRARQARPDALTSARIDAALALDALGDVRNATMQRLVAARAEVLLGRLGEARRVVAEAAARELPADVRAVLRLTEAEIAVRELAATRAAAALDDAKRALE